MAVLNLVSGLAATHRPLPPLDLIARSVRTFLRGISTSFAMPWQGCRSSVAIRSIHRDRNYAAGSGKRPFQLAAGRRAGKAGDGLLLSRTQPRSREAPRASLAEIQHPIIDAYLDALPRGCEPRIMASRSVFAADDREEALRLADIGLRRATRSLRCRRSRRRRATHWPT